jgi:hypothetical protein
MIVIPAVLTLVAGCSGIKASHSVSPATFLLPGIMKAEPIPASPDINFPAEERIKEIAQSQG